MKLTANALKVLRARYLLKDAQGRVVETPEEMFQRVARGIAQAEALYGERPQVWQKRFYELMSSLRFLPNSPALMNAGKELGQLAACFVLPVEDSMESIFGTLKNAALILQSGGGTGVSFSRLRPRADIVRSTGGIASGPVSFMRIYNTATEVIKQGGARRGANMGILRVDHPDILDFIRIKRQAGELANFNISVAVTDAFMEALKKDGEYELVNPRTGQVVKRLKARKVFEEIVSSAWETGDPGLVFIDRINRDNPTPHVGQIESTNPCGEQPLLPYEACVLGSMNLSLYVRGQKYTPRAEIDYDSLRRDIGLAVRLLDDSIDANRYPLPEIERMHKGNRKIGLGVMGWADMLILLGIPYDSARAFALARELMRFIRDSAREASVRLARQRGVSQLPRLGLRPARRPQAPKRHPHHHSPYWHPEHHSRLLQRHRAPVCPGLQAKGAGDRALRAQQALPGLCQEEGVLFPGAPSGTAAPGQPQGHKGTSQGGKEAFQDRP